MNAHDFKYPIAFAKLSGTGNDFIIIDHREMFISEEDQSEFARLVCRRRFSVGADGLILIENSETADFRWQFYNGDGSRAEMCGNGARCAARFAYEDVQPGLPMKRILRRLSCVLKRMQVKLKPLSCNHQESRSRYA
jgi:diaminopimelate epimerase